jgi:hypothetical protein
MFVSSLRAGIKTVTNGLTLGKWRFELRADSRKSPPKKNNDLITNILAAIITTVSTIKNIAL